MSFRIASVALEVSEVSEFLLEAKGLLSVAIEVVWFLVANGFGYLYIRVATLRALVRAGDKTSGDARSWYMISEDAKSWVLDCSAYIHCHIAHLCVVIKGSFDNVRVQSHIAKERRERLELTDRVARIERRRESREE
ncbi:hypothetical protein Tco_0206719 [Tanacetum coccineum]